MKPATTAQIAKLKELDLEFDSDISFDDARDLIRSKLVDQPRLNLRTRPDLFNQLVVRSERDDLKEKDDIKYLT